LRPFTSLTTFHQPQTEPDRTETASTSRSYVQEPIVPAARNDVQHSPICFPTIPIDASSSFIAFKPRFHEGEFESDHYYYTKHQVTRRSPKLCSQWYQGHRGIRMNTSPARGYCPAGTSVLLFIIQGTSKGIGRGFRDRRRAAGSPNREGNNIPTNSGPGALCSISRRGQPATRKFRARAARLATRSDATLIDSK
jgi:hypothetical protein